jgi:Lrp/AsnC family leucine-responsive transcriptional regulator
MWLTKHEKAVLKLLVNNAKLSDTSIGNQLNISSQAIGRIRKRLEEDIIKSYTLELDSKKLGINIIALIKIAFDSSENKSLEDLERKIINLSEVHMLLKTISGEKEYILIAGFSDMEELERFVNQKKTDHKFNECCIIKEVVSLPLNCVLKNSAIGIHSKMIDICGIRNAESSGEGKNYYDKANNRVL